MTYNPALDGIRAVPVIGVIAFHAGVPGFDAAYLGVDVFFVLSGYLITKLLMEEHTQTGRIGLCAFYGRRFLRLAPPLLLMLATFLAVSPVLWPDIARETVVSFATLAALYLSDYSRAIWGIPWLFGHTWSLSVEEHFYLIWPIAFIALVRQNRRTQIVTLAVAYLVATEWRLANLLLGMDWNEIYFRLDARASGLILGGLLAVSRAEVGRAAADLIGAAALMVLAGLWAVLGWQDVYAALWGFTAAELAAAGLVVAALHRGSLFHRGMSWPPLVGLGLISYGLYLWHQPITWTAARAGLPWQFTLALVVPFSVLTATASYVLVERPMRRLRRKNAPASGATGCRRAPEGRS